jgi:hypothetical protein
MVLDDILRQSTAPYLPSLPADDDPGPLPWLSLVLVMLGSAAVLWLESAQRFALRKGIRVKDVHSLLYALLVIPAVLLVIFGLMYYGSGRSP